MAITAKLKGPPKLTAKLKGIPKLTARLTGDQYSMVVSGEPYTGEYFVIPKVDEQTVLETEAKLMERNVTVERIPIYEAANAAGGNTLSIGEMYYG